MNVLWSVLAVIGTVLLFLLKGMGILLLVVLVLSLLLIVNFREMHQTKQAEKRNKALQKDGVKGGVQ